MSSTSWHQVSLADSPPTSTADNGYTLPVHDEIALVSCNHCHKSLLQSSLEDHLNICPIFNAHPIETIPMDVSNVPSPSPSIDSIAKKKIKKKKKKDLDLDVQCGVRLDNGTVCARAITCKIHSVAAKRAVAGRTSSYDILSQEYQTLLLSKKEQVRVKKVTDVPPEEEFIVLVKAIQSFQPQPIASFTPFDSLSLWNTHQRRLASMSVFK